MELLEIQTDRLIKLNDYIIKSMLWYVSNVVVYQLHSGHLPGMSVGGNPGKASLPPLCLHWQH